MIVTRRLAAHDRLRDAAYHWARVAAQRDPVSHDKYRSLRTRGHGHARALRFGGRPTAERRLRDAARRCPVRPVPRRDWRCLSESSTGSSWRPDQAPRILFVERGPAFWLARKNFPHGQPRRSPGGP